MSQFVGASVTLLWIVVVANMLLTLALIRRVNASSQIELDGGLDMGASAPDFTAQTPSGESVTSANYAGKDVAFIFIGPTCRPCREGLPKYEALASRAARQEIDLVLVSRGDAEQTRALVDEFGLKLPVLIAPEGSNPFMEDYRLSLTPSYCLVNRHGKVVSSGYPYLDRGIWKELAESPDPANVEQEARVATKASAEKAGLTAYLMERRDGTLPTTAHPVAKPQRG